MAESLPALPPLDNTLGALLIGSALTSMYATILCLRLHNFDVADAGYLVFLYIRHIDISRLTAQKLCS